MARSPIVPSPKSRTCSTNGSPASRCDEIRATLASRVRDSAPSRDAHELLNVFVQEGDVLFDVPLVPDDEGVVLGQTSVLAEQPEFASGDNMRRLIALTDRQEQLADMLRRRQRKFGHLDYYWKRTRRSEDGAFDARDRVVSCRTIVRCYRRHRSDTHAV